MLPLAPATVIAAAADAAGTPWGSLATLGAALIAAVGSIVANRNARAARENSTAVNDAVNHVHDGGDDDTRLLDHVREIRQSQIRAEEFIVDHGHHIADHGRRITRLESRPNQQHNEEGKS
ncbi:MAG: hypothetical protein AAGA42_11235 [Actinomycetota bacterium]